MMPTIGDHIGRIRRQRQLTQEQLAERAGVSVDTIKKLEQGTRTSARIATLAAIARALGVQTSELFGDASRAAAMREPAARPLGLVEIRRALTPVHDFGGQPIVDDSLDRPPTIAGMRESVREANRVYHANDYATTLAALPGLLAEARALVSVTDGDDQVQAYGLHARAHQLAGRLMIQLRQTDLAHVALSIALDSARRTGDPLVGAALITSSCWLLVRQGRVTEAERLAARTADTIEPRMSRATPTELALWGDLLVRAAAAAARDNRPDTATEMLDMAAAAAARLGDQPRGELEATSGTDLSTTSVAMMRVEVAAVTGQPDRALALASEVRPTSLATPSSQQRHRLDVAWAHAERGDVAEATRVLMDLRDRAPAWLRQQRYARDIVRSIAARRRRAMSQELAELTALVDAN